MVIMAHKAPIFAAWRIIRAGPRPRSPNRLALLHALAGVLLLQIARDRRCRIAGCSQAPGRTRPVRGEDDERQAERREEGDVDLLEVLRGHRRRGVGDGERRAGGIDERRDERAPAGRARGGEDDGGGGGRQRDAGDEPVGRPELGGVGVVADDGAVGWRCVGERGRHVWCGGVVR